MSDDRIGGKLIEDMSEDELRSALRERLAVNVGLAVENEHLRGGDDDWTRALDGRTNSSEQYLTIVKDVANSIFCEFRGLRPESVMMAARLIVSRLAHEYGMAPR